MRKNIRSELLGIADHNFKSTGSGVDWLIYMLTALKYPMPSTANKPLSSFRANGGTLAIQNNNMVTIGLELSKRWLDTALKMQRPIHVSSGPSF